MLETGGWAVVGSTNPVKVEAVRAVTAAVFPGMTVMGVEVPSGVRAQPIGDAETREGALNRAKAALESTEEAALGIGLEGGVDFIVGIPYVMGWGAVVSRDGETSVARGLTLPLPPSLAEELKAGAELGPLMDKLAGLSDTKRKSGAIGILTGGVITRRQSWEAVVAAALAPFLRPEWYAGRKEGILVREPPAQNRAENSTATPDATLVIREFRPEDYDAVAALWRSCGLSVGRSEQPEGIAKKLERDPDLFLVAERGGEIVAAVVGTYDGRRGSFYRFGVRPDLQKQGIGSRLLAELEARFKAKGVHKVLLQVHQDNAAVEEFYRKLGYERAPVFVMWKEF